MSTFNAGAIEATLALGRTSWTRDLKKTQKEIADLERQSITIGIDADATNAEVAMNNIELFLEDLDSKTFTPSIDLLISEAEEALDRFEARLDALDARTVVVSADADIINAEIQLDNLEKQMDLLEADGITISADADIADAQATLAELDAMCEALDTNTIYINADVDDIHALEQLAMLETQIDILDGREIDINVDLDKAALTSLVGSGAGGEMSGGHLGLLRILIYAILALAPLLSVALGALSAAIVGFTAAVVGAVGPVAVLAAGLVGLIAKMDDFSKRKGPIGAAARDMQDAIDNLKGVWNDFLKAIAPEGFDLMAKAIDLLAKALPPLTPLFKATAKAMGGVLDSIAKWMDSPQFQRMIDFFMGFGLDMLIKFIEIGGNLLEFFGGLFEAIEPFARQMMQGLADTTEGWAKWAAGLKDNKAFQDWVDNAIKYGPMVLDMLGSLIDAFLNITHALEPFAGPMLKALTTFFDLIASIPTDTLSILIGLLAALWVGMVAIPAVVGAVVTAFEAVAAVIALIASPIGLIVLAIVGLVATFVYLWKTNEDFRDGIIDTWNYIRDAVTPIISDLVNFIKESWGPLKDWIMDIWSSIQSIVVDAVTIIEQIVKGVVATIVFIWEHFGEDILRVVKGIFKILGAIIKGGFQIIKGIFHTVASLLKWDWSGVWDGIKDIAKGAMTILSGLFRGWKDILGGIWNAIKTVVSAAWNALWDLLKDAWRKFRGWIDEKWENFKGLFTFDSGTFTGIWDGLKNAFKDVINTIIGWWNNLSFHIPGFDPPGPGPKFSGIDVGTPNIPTLADGGFFTDAVLAIVGEGPDNEIVAPEPVLRDIVHAESGMDYEKLAQVLASVLAPLMRQGITPEQLQALIDAASVNLSIDARSDHGAAGRLAAEVGYQLRLMGWGGVDNAA